MSEREFDVSRDSAFAHTSSHHTPNFFYSFHQMWSTLAQYSIFLPDKYIVDYMVFVVAESMLLPIDILVILANIETNRKLLFDCLSCFYQGQDAVFQVSPYCLQSYISDSCLYVVQYTYTQELWLDNFPNSHHQLNYYVNTMYLLCEVLNVSIMMAF